VTAFIMAVIAILTVSNVVSLWLYWRAKKSAVNAAIQGEQDLLHAQIRSLMIPCNVWEVSVKRRTMRELPAIDDDYDDINTMIGDML
jgi:hypothetical protein